MSEPEEVLRDIPAAMEYIGDHEEINNVLLTGGDPMMLPTAELNHIIENLRTIDHVQIVRMGSRMLSYKSVPRNQRPHVHADD